MSESSGMHFDFTSWPIITIRQVGTCTDEQVTAYLQEMKKTVYERKSYHALVLDLRDGVAFNSKQRKMQSEWLLASRDRVHFITAVAFVEDSIIMRGAMQAAFWLNPPEYPYFVTKDVAQAREWAKAQYQARSRTASAA